MNSREPSKQRILTTAFDLFHSKGVSATGLDEILQLSKTGKGQFYHYFESKDDLIHHLFLGFLERLKSGSLGPLQTMNSYSDIERWFRFFVEASKAMKCARNCPVATIATELDESQGSLRKDARDIFEYMRAALAQCFSSMRKKGELPHSLNSDSMADFCIAVMQGGLLVAKIQRDITPFEHAVSHALKYIKSMMSE